MIYIHSKLKLGSKSTFKNYSIAAYTNQYPSLPGRLWVCHWVWSELPRDCSVYHKQINLTKVAELDTHRQSPSPQQGTLHLAGLCLEQDTLLSQMHKC